jgi:hypothetical protein
MTYQLRPARISTPLAGLFVSTLFPPCGLCATYSSKPIEPGRRAGNRCDAAIGLCRESHSAETFVCQIFVMEEHMASSIAAISERSAPSTKSVTPVGTAGKAVSDACFNDWKRFCFVLREIASGENGRPLSGLEAQQRAQAVLTECSYTWPGRAQAYEPVVAPTAAPESPNTQAPVGTQQSSTGTNLKSVGKAQSRPGRRVDPHPREHRVSASTNSSPT